jgi:hypothetical protein
MSQVSAIIRAMEILEPIVTQTVEWLQGGVKPEFVSTLPPVAKSRIAYNATRAGLK